MAPFRKCVLDDDVGDAVEAVETVELGVSVFVLLH